MVYSPKQDLWTLLDAYTAWTNGDPQIYILNEGTPTSNSTTGRIAILEAKLNNQTDTIQRDDTWMTQLEVTYESPPSKTDVELMTLAGDIQKAIDAETLTGDRQYRFKVEDLDDTNNLEQGVKMLIGMVEEDISRT